MRIAVVVGVAWMGLLSARIGWAAPHPLVQQARIAYDNVDYDKATDLARKALLAPLDREEKVAVLETLAFALVAAGKSAEAKAVLQRLLRIEPKYVVAQMASPKLRAAVDAARAELNNDLPFADTAAQRPFEGSSAPATVIPQMRPSAPKEGESVSVTVAAPNNAVTGEFHLRSQGTKKYSSLKIVAGQTARGAVFEFRVPASGIHPPGIEYFVTLTNAAGATVAVAGGADAPLYADVLSRGKPVYARGWFWGVISGAAAAAILATTLGVTLGARSNADTASVGLRFR